MGELVAKTVLPVSNPRLSNDAEFFPGMPKTWALTFMINEEDAPTGRPAGALAWAGLANLYYWIDRANGVGGFWATQIFPSPTPPQWSGSSTSRKPSTTTPSSGPADRARSAG